jgi:negative regulator of sigma E activity
MVKLFISSVQREFEAEPFDAQTQDRTHTEKSRQQSHNYLTTTKSWFKATDNLAKVASVKLC